MHSLGFTLLPPSNKFSSYQRRAICSPRHEKILKLCNFISDKWHLIATTISHRHFSATPKMCHKKFYKIITINFFVGFYGTPNGISNRNQHACNKDISRHMVIIIFIKKASRPSSFSLTHKSACYRFMILNSSSSSSFFVC
jgi:hypothetical protein